MACFVAVDCGYYCFHRLSHEIGFMWAGAMPVGFRGRILIGPVTLNRKLETSKEGSKAGITGP